jgi:hypothetical protein
LPAASLEAVPQIVIRPFPGVVSWFMNTVITAACDSDSLSKPIS